MIGKANVQSSGWIHHFYVHQELQRRWVERALISVLHDEARQWVLQGLKCFVNLKAQPFFEAHDFRIARKWRIERNGVELSSVEMTKRLDESAVSDKERKPNLKQ